MLSRLQNGRKIYQDGKRLQNLFEMSRQAVRNFKLNVIVLKKTIRFEHYFVTYIYIFVFPSVQITSVKVPGDKTFGVFGLIYNVH